MAGRLEDEDVNAPKLRPDTSNVRQEEEMTEYRNESAIKYMLHAAQERFEKIPYKRCKNGMGRRLSVNCLLYNSEDLSVSLQVHAER